jgi:hypothetical protein
MSKTNTDHFDMAKAARLTREAAEKFSKVYAALKWQWSAGGFEAPIHYVPNAAAIATLLWGMVSDLNKRLGRRRKPVTIDTRPESSYSTGGLCVVFQDGELTFRMEIDHEDGSFVLDEEEEQ